MFKGKFFTTSAVIIAAFVLLGGAFSGGFYLGQKMPQNLVISGVANIENSTTTAADFSTFWQTWKTINDNYLKDGEVADQKRVYGAIRGLVASLGDPHSMYLEPSDSQKFQEDIQGEFGGIGAEIGIKRNQLVVVAPLKDTPASRAGLLAGDKILKISSTSTEGLTVEEAVKLIRGPLNTEVVLNVYRDDWEVPRDFKLLRAKISAPTVDLKMEENIAHLQLYSFNANANRLFYEALITALQNNAQGMVLDLRNDPGGYLEVAVDIAGWFLPKGALVVSETQKNALPQEFRSNGSGALSTFPVVILINGGSASASEILAGALRVQRGIKLIGEQSYGKGTVQQLFPLKDDSSVKLTVAQWVLPDGAILEGNGLKPDMEIKITEDDIKNKKDPQLEKAVEVLKESLRNTN